MGDIGWYKNHTYTRNHINLFTYIQLALQNLLPVSELYLWGQPATSAFQMPGDWIERIHIR